MASKNIISVISGFLGHHIVDLNAVAGSLTAILDALPVNAETRAHVADVISKVTVSANNIDKALKNTTFDAPPVIVKASDVEKALTDYLASPAFERRIAAAVAKATPKPATPPIGVAS